MDLTSFSFKRSRFVWFAVVTALLASVLALRDFPSQEEPSIHIRIAATYAVCPGMSVYQLENLVARPMEERIREMAEVKKINTRVRPGFVLITVEIQDRYTDLQPIWQRLRSKMRELEPSMPDGVRGPFVDDDYGRVTVASMAIMAPGFEWNEIRERAKWMRDRLYSIKGTEKIAIHGLDNEAIYLETSNAELARRGLSPAQLATELARQNIIIPAGEIESGKSIVPVSTTGNLLSLEDISRTPISLSDGKVAYLGDLVKIRRGLSEPRSTAAFFNGEPAVVLAVSMADGQNVLSFCDRLKTRVTELERELPAGFRVEFVTFQAQVVTQEINRVKHVLFETLVVVLLVVVLFVGLRTGVIVGTIVPLTLMMALLVMRWFGIELHTVSMAALIISLGLLVDNGIVIAEDVLRRLSAGSTTLDAAQAAGKTLAIPLLTSTLACVAAFLPLTLSKTVSGEYARCLSTVLTITLLCSWVLCLTVTPLLCGRYARVNPKHKHDDEEGAYQTRFYQVFRKLIEVILSHRVTYLAGMVLLLVVAVIASTKVPQSFLPNSGRMQIQIPIDLSPNSSADETISSVKRIATWLNDRKENPNVVNHIAYIGEGGPRVVLALDPPDPIPHSAYIIINMSQGTDPAKLLEHVRGYFDTHGPELRAVPRRFSFGMHDAGTVVYRISGPDVATLRELSVRFQKSFQQVQGTRDVRDDWEAEVGRFQVVVDQDKARKAGVSSADIATSLRLVYGAQPITGYREDDRTLPVLWRAPESERKAMDRLSTAMVFPASGAAAVPLSQVAKIDYMGEPSIIRRYNLERTVSVYGRNPGLSSYQLAKAMEPLIKKMELPAGYRVELGGEIEENEEANQALFEFLPLSVILLLGVFISQFNSIRKVIVIMASVPFCFIGVVVGMLVLRGEFNFMAMLGMLALAGIIVSNAVLLLDRIEAELHKGRTRHEAIVMASMMRLRPILMTKLTCVTGMIPMLLFGGPLWHGLAVAIIGGLSLGTLVTLGLIPVLYSWLFRKEPVKLTGVDKVAPLFVGLLALLGFSGCAVGPDYHAPKMEAPKAFTETSGTSATNYQSRWWTNFNDATLERLVSDTMVYNHDVRASTERLKSVRAMHRLVKWGYAPSGTASTGYQRKQVTPVEMPGADRDMRNFDLYDAGFDATWELDVFGKVRRQNEAFRAAVEAMTAQRDGILISVTAEIAREYFELRDLQRRLDILNQLCEMQRESLRLARLRADAGKGTQMDVQLLTVKLTTMEAQLPEMRTGIAQLEHAIGLLSGHDHLELKPLLEASHADVVRPPTVWLGSPGELLRRRPDVRIAEQRLKMSTAWIGAEMANYFPHVSFNGSMALESKTFSGMSEPQADAYSFGPRITWTAFDMGRIKARVDAAKADTKAQLAGYEKTVLAALAETDGALIAYGHDQARRKSIQTAVDAARKARDIARQRQKEGMADKMAVLELDRHLLETQSALCEAQTAENTRVVAIYKSLGGGWEASPLPTEKR